jgi:excinuclease ABC subunit B
MYADSETGSMKRAIDETNRRRRIQQAYNEKHGIVPKTIVKDIRAPIEITSKKEAERLEKNKKLSKEEKKKLIDKLTADMKRAAKDLDFETAALIRDKIRRLM